jgi:uncharacterized phiE125 gp8 family phage protein
MTTANDYSLFAIRRFVFPEISQSRGGTMKKLLLEGPAAEPVLLAEAKAHLRLDGAEEDALVGALIAAARTAVETETRRVLIEQRWRAFVETWPHSGVELPVAPALSVETVRGIDGEGVATALDPGDYEFDVADGSVRLLRPAAGAERYEIDFAAGYGDAGEDVPGPLRQAMLMLITHWFEHRSAVAVGDVPAETPLGWRALAAPYRRMALC